jgi:hypothetical protein
MLNLPKHTPLFEISQKRCFWHFFLFLICFACTQQESDPTSNMIEEELLALEQLLHSPEQSVQICDKTTNPSILKQCTKLKSRPHLYKVKESTGNKRKTTAYKSPLSETSVSTKPCSSNVFECRIAYAKRATTQEGRAAECLALPTKSVWQAECFFETAEEGLKQKKLSYTDAAELCTLSDRFQYNCLQHLSVNKAELDRSLTEYKEGAQQIHEYWQKRDIGLSTKMQQIYWITAMEFFYAKSKILNHQPFQILPKQAHPHIWAGLTQEIVKRSTTSKTLSEWTEILLLLHEGKKSISLSTIKNQRQKQRVQVPYKKNKTSFPMVLYIEEHKRVLGETPEEEIQICLIRAAQIHKRFPSWINEAKKSSSLRIQASAKN